MWSQKMGKLTTIMLYVLQMKVKKVAKKLFPPIYIKNK